MFRIMVLVNVTILLMISSIAELVYATDYINGISSGGVSGNYYDRQYSFSDTDPAMRRDFWNKRRLYGNIAKSTPFEIEGAYTNVSMLTGTLLFSNTDFSLPGRAKSTLAFKRVYNSHVCDLDKTISGDTPSATGNENLKYSFGPGWYWSVGRILGDTLYYPNGSSEILLRDISADRHKNRNYEVISSHPTSLNPDTLLRLDGTKIIFDNYYFFSNPNINNAYGGKHVVKIVSANDSNSTIITYYSQVPLVKKITDAASREIWFDYSYTDTSGLNTTRLKKLNYRTSQNDTLAISYVYDYDQDSLYGNLNPLIMAVYPDGDTIRYAYDSTATYQDSTYSFPFLWLKEVSLPFGEKYTYTWACCREREISPDSLYIWNINVKSIARHNDDSSIDTIKFGYDYTAEYDDCKLSEEYIDSYLRYPDNRCRYYRHTRIKPQGPTEYQNSGLLTKIAYYNDYSDTTNSLVYSFRIRDDDYCRGYTSYTIGTDLADTKAPYDSLKVAVLDSFQIVMGRYPNFTYDYDFSDFNVNTGLHNNISDFRTLTTSFRNYVSSSNKAYLDSSIESSIAGGKTDSIVTRIFSNISTMKMDSTEISSGGNDRITKFEYDSYGNMTKEIAPLGDTVAWEYSSSLNHCYPTRFYCTYGDFWRRDYYLNSGKEKSSVSSSGDSTFYYYDQYDRLTNIKRPLESGYSLIRTYDRSNEAIIDSLKTGTSSYRIENKYYDGFGRLLKTKLLDSDIDSVIAEIGYDYQDRVAKRCRPYTSTADTVWYYLTRDVLGRKVRFSFVDGTIDSFHFASDTSYSYMTKTLPGGRLTKALANLKGELVNVISDSLCRDTVEHQYTTFSRISSTTDARGLERIYLYDAFGNLTGDSTADSGMKRAYWDSRDSLRFIRTAAGSWIYRKYDLIGRLKEKGTATSIDTTKADDAGYPDSNYTVWTIYKYDSYSSGYAPPDTSYRNNPDLRLTEVNDRSGYSWYYYDDRGRLVNVTTQIDGYDDTLNVFLEYGPGDQITKIIYPDSTQITYEYYDSMRLRNIPGYIYHSGTVGGFRYNAYGDLKERTFMGDSSFTTSYSYNPLGTLKTILARLGGTTKWGRAYYYDDSHMLSLSKHVDSTGTATNDTSRIYEYDNYLRRATAIIADADPEITLYYGYDGNINRIYRKKDADSTAYYYYPGSDLLSYISGQDSANYLYNQAGKLIADTSKNIRYYYNPEHRLDSVNVMSYKRYAFYYNYLNQCVKSEYYTGVMCDSVEWSDDNHNDYCEHDLPTCAYTPGDVDGDSAGCGLSDVIYIISYYQGGPPPPYPIFRGDADCNSSIGLSDVTYVINCYQGTVPPKCCYWIRTDTTSTYRMYVYGGLLSAYSGQDTLMDNYIYAYRQNPVAKYNPVDGKRFYINDIRGSVVAVIDSVGNILTEYDYYPFGLVHSVSGLNDIIKFRGQEYYEGYEIDIYRRNAIYTDPYLGRIIAR